MWRTPQKSVACGKPAISLSNNYKKIITFCYFLLFFLIYISYKDFFSHLFKTKKN